MHDTFYRPADSLRYRIAPTEVTPPRGYPLQGEVHDENAYALGGIAGHAGLFSTAADLSIFAQMMLNGGTYDGVSIISEPTVSLFTKRAEMGHRALGWDTADGDYGSGQYLTERAYGHTGFTGTSIWIDPDREMFVILLTNRVHAAKASHPGKVIADVRADLSDASVLAVMDGPMPMLSMPLAFRADRELGWNTPIRPVRCSAVKSRRGKSVRSSRSRARVSCRLASSKRSKSSKGSSAKSRSSKRSIVSSKKHTTSKSSVKKTSAKKSSRANR
jgi:CubicO group peptidase (beta-lactamase class C family)